MKRAFIGYQIQLLACGLCLAIVAGCSTERFKHITTPTSVVALEVGQTFVRGLAACGYCHGSSLDPEAPMSGGRSYTDLYGERKVPNITPASQALGGWSNEDLLHYFRTGIDRQGEQLSQAPHRGMEWMADEDLFAIVAYLRTLPAVDGKEFHAEPLTFVDRNTSGFFEGRREVTGFVPTIAKRSALRYGQYLVEHVAACGRCHNSPNSILSSSQFLQGGASVITAAGDKTAPNITNDPKQGIGRWSEAQIIHYLQTGIKAKGGKVDARFCPVDFYRNAPDDDLRSIAQYLKTVTPEE